MPQKLSLSYLLPGPPAEIMTALKNRDFVVERLSVLHVTSAEVVAHEVDEDRLSTIVVTTVPRSILPKAVRGFTRGEPGFTRREDWEISGEEYVGFVAITLDGVPSDIMGQMRLRRHETGSRMTFDCSVILPIPVFGSQVEPVVAGQIRETADAEAHFLQKWLAR